MYSFGDGASAEAEAAYLNESAAASPRLRVILDELRHHRGDVRVS
jgi:hypothetical protein